jgi:hypothetical protein
MKRGTIEHPKLAALASMLGVRRHVAVGLLEMLWHHTARYAPRGDIGKYKDCQIAAALDWPNDDSARLMKCLVECGWLDEHQEFRLIVHDWHEHSDGTCDRYLGQHGLTYAQGRATRREYKPINEEVRASAGSCAQVRDSASYARAHAPARLQNQNQNQNQNQGDHPEFARMLAEAKENALDEMTWETWKILLHNYGLDDPACGMTEAEVVEQLLPAVRTCPPSDILRKGAGQWVGWRLDDVVKRRSAILKKNGAPAGGGAASGSGESKNVTAAGM